MVVPFYCGDNTGVYANAGFAIAVFAIAVGYCVLYCRKLHILSNG